MCDQVGATENTRCGGGSIGRKPKAGDSVRPRWQPSEEGAPTFKTTEKTGFTYVDGNIHFKKWCRKGGMRHPKWHLVAIRTSDAKLRFRSWKARVNYDMVMPKVDPSDFDLMDRSFDLHTAHTRRFRSQAREKELLYRGTAHTRGANWLDQFRDFSDDCCLFFPNAKAGVPEKVKYNYASMSAARAMLLKVEGRPEDDGLVVVHKCGMGHMSCVNPKHLAWGTASDNAKDRVLHGRGEFDPSECDREIAQRILEDNRLAKVVAWDLRISVGIVSAVRSQRIYEDMRPI
ncbi:hypothetical protein VWZ82_12970 [Phaeobacter sp. JH20_41]|uniref:hypothetical protein n=1 Tax=Phaeobacter sp. JH20_41 TaxID=3112498 RepID=UPI003A879774